MSSKRQFAHSLEQPSETTLSSAFSFLHPLWWIRGCWWSSPGYWGRCDKRRAAVRVGRIQANLHVFDWRGDARPDMQYYLNISGVIEPLAITTTLRLGATRGVAYQQQFASRGGSGSVTWSIDGGSLPPGWTLSSAGLLSGVATADGFYTFSVRATDSANPPQIAHTQYTLQIAEPLVITSSATFPNACANKPYSFTVTTSGGVPPIYFSFISSAWVSINLNTSTGTFSGTTSVTGTFTGMLGTGDSAVPQSGQSQTVTLTIVNCP
jgi:Putative Ig domain